MTEPLPSSTPTFAKATPSWPERTVAPDGAPNVLIVMIDDLGFSDVGCYGSEIPTPHIDALASDGLRYTNFHANPMCSPTRASLLTGLNAHDAGVGFVAECDPGQPGYAGEICQNAATIAELLRDSGWSTYMVGKWHLCKPQNRSASGDRSSWPVQRGFDEFYGILNGFTNFFHPHRLIEGNSVVEVDSYPDDYHLTDDLTDRAVSLIHQSAVEHPTKPFLMYLAHPAVHAPLHARADDVAAHQGNYDCGWDTIRDRRHARQQDLGVLPDAALAPRNQESGHEVEAWDSIDADTRALYARYMEVYAGMVSAVDRSIGRVVEALEVTGQLDNTVIIFTSDNGASREGEATGSSQYFQILPPAMESDVSRDQAVLDLIGGPQTMPHYPRGWAMACNTPLRLYKTHTHAGGHQVPMIVRSPDTAGEAGQIRTQYTHVTDIFPTLLDLCGVERPGERNGIELKEPAGSSFVPTIGDAQVPSAHTEQYYELSGSRSMYADGWEAVTQHQPYTNFVDEPWELFDLKADPSQTVDLSSSEPDRLAELQQRWHQAALANQVYPIDEGAWVKMITRPDHLDELGVEVTVHRDAPTLDSWRSGRLIQMRNCDIAVRFEWTDGDQGTLISHGDQGGGYAVYVINGTVRYVENCFGTMHELTSPTLEAGDHRVDVAFFAHADRTRSVECSVDGVSIGRIDDLPPYAGIAPFQGIDVGADRRSPVSWAVHEAHGHFAYSGAIEHATWTPGAFPDGAGEALLEMMRKVGERYD